MSDKVNLDNYVDVATRIGEFRKKHPQGSLQPADLTKPYSIERIGDQIYIVVVAAAYRDAEDTKPGIGMAYEPFPGRTPYTRGSELQNAETSAWGRAVVAVLAAGTRKGVSSADEVRNRRADDEEMERRKVERPELTPAELISQLRSQCMTIWQQRGGNAAGMADEYASWSSGPDDPSGRDIAIEDKPELLAEFMRYLRKQANP